MGVEFLIETPLTRFLAQAVAIIVVSRVLGLAARRLGQPMVIAEIIAGIVLGPSLLGWLAPQVVAAVFTPTRGILQMVSEVGLILFMFLVGLELDPELLRGRGRASIVISHTSIVVPFALGGLLAVQLHGAYAPAGVAVLPFALFLGAAMSVTAFPVLARILAERRLLHTPMGATTIACAAIDDVTAWCILAFVVAIARATGFSAAALTTLLAVGYVAFMLFVARPLLARLGQRISKEEGLTQNVVAGILVALFVSSWIADLMGIHAVFGAFLLGSILPKNGGVARALAEKLEDLVLILLLPLFFAHSGLRTQVGLLDSTAAWATCALIILIASLGKFGGSALAARLTGAGWREAGALGVLMNTRGLMELIVLNIGLDLGVLTPTLFTMMVIMALVTTLATTPILALFYSPARVTRDLLAASRQASEPEPQSGRSNILVCVAQASSGPALLDVALAMRESSSPGDIHALHLQHPTERASYPMRGTHEESDHAALAPLTAHACELGVNVKPLSFISTEPHVDICNLAEARGVELILLGDHKPLVGSQAKFGGTAQTVLRRSTADVAILVDRGLGIPRRILVPFCGSPHDRAALETARRMVRAVGAELTLLHVEPAGEHPDDHVRELAPLTFGERERARVSQRFVEHSVPAAAALEESRAGYDLIVVGVGTEWDPSERGYGAQLEDLIEQATTSLLIVRGGAIEAAPTRASFIRMLPQEA